MNTIKACQVTDEALLRCMTDYLENPSRYHPEYLQVLLKDYERRVVDKIERSAPEAPPPRREFIDIDTSTNATIRIP